MRRRMRCTVYWKLLLGVQLDDKVCGSLVIEILNAGHSCNLNGEVCLVSLKPERNYSCSSLLNNILELSAAAASLVESDNIAFLDTVRGNVNTLAVYSEMSVSNELSCLTSCESETHSVNYVIKSGFEDSDKVITGLALHLGSDLEVVVEGLFKHAVDELQLLLFLELHTILRNLFSAVSTGISLGLLRNAHYHGADAQVSASLEDRFFI